MNDLEQKAITVIATTYILVAEDLKVVNAGLITVADGIEVYHAKVMHLKNGKLYEVVLDLNGKLQDSAITEKAVSVSNSQKMGLELSKKLNEVNSNEKLRVVMWLKEHEEVNLGRPDPFAKLSDEQIENFLRENGIRQKTIIAEAEKQMIDWLKEKGYSLIYASRYAPVVIAEMPASGILEATARKDVLSINLEPKAFPCLNVAAPTIGANIVWNKGYTGTGVKVSVIESHGGDINPDNPYLSGVLRDTTYTCQSDINHSPWYSSNGFSGTSLSAPMVTGSAALVMQRNTALQYWPEAVKAIFMATATHNIEGDSRLSEKDGAGGISVERADTAVANNWWGGTSYTCTSTNPLERTFYANAGEKVRVAIAWDTNPNYTNYTSKPGADLDLRIDDPSGSHVTGSYSWDNTFEIVEFTAPSSGNYTMNIVRFRCDYDPKWLGWAWYRGN